MWRARQVALGKQLSRYWDARSGDVEEADTLAATLDHTMIETIEQVYANDDAQVPHPEFLNQLETTLMSSTPVSLSLPTLPASAPFLANGRAVSPPHTPWPDAVPRVPPRQRGVLAPLATAALVLLVLAGSFFAFGPGRTGRHDDVPALLPIVATPATPAIDGTVEESLLEVTLPPELLPQGERITSEFSYLTMPGESSGSWRGLDRVDWRGLRLHYVLDGSLAIQAEGDARVQRAGAGASLEEVPAGEEVTLGPGDAWVSRNETPYEVRTPETAPARFLVWVLANIADPSVAYIYLEPGPWTIDYTDPLPPGVVVPTDPVMLRIRLLELPVDGRLPAAPGVILQQGVRPPTNAEGTPVIDPSLGTLRSGTLVNLSRKPVTVYALSLEPSGAGADTAQTGTPES
jgi:hypothetical protein